jgi:hypothetical protein
MAVAGEAPPTPGGHTALLAGGPPPEAFCLVTPSSATLDRFLPFQPATVRFRAEGPVPLGADGPAARQPVADGTFHRAEAAGPGSAATQGTPGVPAVRSSS